MDIYFEIESCLGKRIGIIREDWEYITRVKHPELSGREEQIKSTLVAADFVRLSQRDLDVFLYYKHFEKYYLCVVCRHTNGSGFIITCYLTDRLKKGKDLWLK